MKRKCVFFILVVFTVVYMITCFYMLGIVDPFKRKIDILIQDRGLSPEKIDLAHQLFKPVCVCTSPILHTDKKDSQVIEIQAAKLDQQTCTSLQYRRTSADIQVSSLYSTLQLHYDNYLFHHRGWISHYEDVSYRSSQWDVESLEVYIVPFSHQDPGWRSTVDSLYETKAEPTLNNIQKYLSSHTNLTFVWSEVIYLHKWYNLANTDYQEKLKKLLAGGRFEIVTGGWVMTDEAVTHYYSMLDQLIEGHQWLHDKLNYTVQTSWSIDPFGLSPTMAYLLRRSGVDSHLIQRVHYSLKRALADRKQLEFLWRQAWDPGNSTDLFTHIPPFLLYNILYNCGPDPEVCCQFDFHKKNCYSEGKYIKPDAISDENIHEKAMTLLDQLRKKAQFFKHKKLLMLYGDDFRFSDEKEWHSLNVNFKRLVDYMNTQKNMHVRLKFSTLRGYFDSVKSTLPLHHQTIPSLSGDFLTYNDRDDQYWSGYYTSRPLYKYMARKLQEKLRSAEILFSLLIGHVNRKHTNRLLRLIHSMYTEIEKARHALGLAQHHDAITGTSKPSVMSDYFLRLFKALARVRRISGICISRILQPDGDIEDSNTNSLYQSLDVQLDSKEPILGKVILEDNNVLAVFNPLPTIREEFITMTTSFPYVRVEDIDGNLVHCQVAPLWDNWLKIAANRYKVTVQTSLQALAITKFYVKRAEKDDQNRCPLAAVTVKSPLHNHNISSVFSIEWSGLESFTLQTPLIQAYFCGCTGMLQGVFTKDNHVYHPAKLGFVHYGTGSWTNPLQDKSGTYIFLPNGPARIRTQDRRAYIFLPINGPARVLRTQDGRAYIFPPNGPAQDVEVTQPRILIVDGPLTKEIHTTLPMVTHTVTLYNSTGPKGASVHIDNTVNITAYKNTELALRVTTDINNENIFYTDNNGFQMQRRRYLPQYKIQGNYYPITTQMYIEDPLFRVTLHTSYSHGASSQYTGSMEVMLDRRLVQDDWRGLGMGVMDNVITPSSFVLLWETRNTPWKPQNLERPSQPSLLSHQVSLQLNHPVELFLQQRATTLPIIPYQPLTTSWPCDFVLVNLRSLGVVGLNTNGASLLLVHRLAYDCDFVSVYQECDASDGKLNLDAVLSSLEIIDFEETSLTGRTLQSKTKQSDHVIKIPLMEIKAYRIILH